MKKRILAAILAALTIAAVSVTAVGCGSAPEETEKTETSQAPTEKKEEKKSDKKESIENIVYEVPEDWEGNSTTSWNLTLNYYYPKNHNGENSIGVSLYTLDNVIYTYEEAEKYLKDDFVPTMVGSMSGSDQPEYKDYDVDVPAVICTYETESTEEEKGSVVKNYCFLTRYNKILVVSYWHEQGSKDYTDEFESLIDSLEFPELVLSEIVKDEKQIEREKREEEQKIKNTPPAIGMTKEQVKSGLWGTPNDINTDEYAWGTQEQWVYDDRGYIYFEDGIVTAIQHR